MLRVELYSVYGRRDIFPRCGERGEVDGEQEHREDGSSTMPMGVLKRFVGP